MTGRSGSITGSDLLACRVHIEHGWLCLRTRGGWLLWSKKVSDVPMTGLDLETIVGEINGPQCTCVGEPHDASCDLVLCGVIKHDDHEQANKK